MRVTQHHITSRPLIAFGAMLMTLVISGCSAVNMTGFSMPVFGLTKKSADESDALTTSSIPPDQEQHGVQSGTLANQ